MDTVGLGTVFGSEVLGTAILILLGVGVVANVSLPKSFGNGGGWIVIIFGWGLAVFAGVYAAASSGAHLNPAVTIGLLVSGADQYAPGVDVSVASTLVYLAAELIGAILGAVLAWAAYRAHYDDPEAAGTQLGTFSTGPAIKSTADNLVTEAIGTFVLIYIILRFGDTPTEIGPLAVALLVVGIGASLGGPTGYAINPARDLGPRIAHAILPIKGKGDSNWGYAWVPVVGPLIGAVLAGGLSHVSF
ncbi:aquaporin family protein [Modestobacter sp. I12A-02628]|uniref:Aquaporin family protein n=1 Tax=Goekera deserti TaxID=2497753 RepID=A0A7K3WFR9_9ACTN|nr:MIP/aquaporin family protein [Goekera deserti]MPR00397.1 aquaporin family protein [Goekera deserti]NDI50399.1 aquaporin family protein [Goekera deserti]NEL55335.1 aquaporin family protein [Goekera deserti]